MSFLYATSFVVSLFIVTLWFLLFICTLGIQQASDKFDLGCKAIAYLLLPMLLSAGWLVHVVTSLK